MKDYSSIVVSSKIKLLRNLTGFEFPSVLSGDDGIKTLNKVADAIVKINPNFKLYKIKTLPELDINIMHEKRLISENLMNAFAYGAVALFEDEYISIMINESDHIVEQIEYPGLNLIAAFDRLNVFDNEILRNLNIAYDDSIGFLTSSLNKVGTGMAASISLFLPALELSGKIKEVIDSYQNQGIKIDAIGDDVLDSRDYTYFVSNSTTIGKKETDYVVKITESVIQICEMEIRARTELLSNKNIDNVKDMVCRAWGILTNCYKISVEETHKFLGDLKMGVALDLIRFKDVDFLDKLMIDIEPYSLTKISESKVADVDLDKYRALFLARILKLKRIK